MSRAPGELPDWLVEPPSYLPPRDRDGFLRDNLLRLASLPARLAPAEGGVSPADRLLAGVPAALRLVGLLVAVGCVSAASNMSFVWVVLAGLLVSLALRPTGQLRAIVPVSVGAALVGGLVLLPGAVAGMVPPSGVTRMVVKTFCTVGITLGFAQGVSWPRMAAALAALRVPAVLVLVLDSAVRGIAVLGRVATQLTEALALRSVGRNRDKSSSAGAVLGMTFVHASVFSQAQAEAMACRGYDGQHTAAAERTSGGAAVCYALALAALVAAFAWLERAMGVA